jgi:GNAT superfamily N-acetyltransferase
MENYHIEKISQENFVLFHELFEAVFNVKIPLDTLVKKYDTQYLGPSFEHLGFIAFNSAGEAVSYYGVIPCKVQVDGMIYMAAQSCDTMTRADYRGQQLIVRLQRMTIARCREVGLTLLFAFANQNSLKVFTKHGWTQIDTTQVFQIDVITFPLSAILYRIPILKNLYSKYFKRRTKSRLSYIPIQTNSHSSILRDQAFHQYKSYSTTYTLLFDNAKVWVKLKGSLFIGDIAMVDGGEFNLLIDELKVFAFRIGIRKIFFIASSTLTITKLFREYYHPIDGHGVVALVLDKNSKVDIHKLRFTYGDFDTF